ncbi:hypothetical protein ACO2Q8_26550 [Larkinella sp. VNQ87]|uniref:hypothetical protein n=1 Tax=Larkinella sp. VNQ87 TaxID=3400921 RepID=UPI003BFB7568
MTTLRLFTVLGCLVAGLTATHAQSLLTRNSATTPTDPETAVSSPRKLKATESPVYVKVYGFYGLLTPGSQITSSSTSNSSGSTSTSFKTNKRGLGAGPRTGIGIGLIISDFINLGIDADMLFGAPISTANSYKGTNYTYNNTSSTTLRVLSITPNITFKALSRPAYYIYNRLGVVVGKVMDYKGVQDSENIPAAGASTISNTTEEYTKNTLALGYQAALGIQFRLSQSLRGFVEVVAYNQSFKPRELHNVSVSTRNGGIMNQSSYYVEYKDQGEYTTTNRDGDEVYQGPSYNVAMNSVGVGAGIVFRF